METVDILLADFRVVVQFGRGGHIGFRSLQHQGWIVELGDILVPMAQTLDHPGRLQIDENGQIVGGVGLFEDAHHLHLERVDPGQIEEAFR